MTATSKGADVRTMFLAYVMTIVVGFRKGLVPEPRPTLAPGLTPLAP